MLNLRHLHYFWIAAQEGRLVQAAKKLRISQPALSNQLKHFEEVVGRKLLVRSSKGVQLTQAGREVYEYATQIFKLQNALTVMLKKSAPPEGRCLRVGVQFHLARLLTLDLLAQLQGQGVFREFSQLAVSLIVPGEASTQASLEEYDLLLTSELPRSSVVRPVRHLELPVSLLVPHAHSTAFKEVIGKRASTEEEIVEAMRAADLPLLLLTRRNCIRAEIDAFFRRVGLTPKILLESDSMDALAGALNEGHGATILPGCCISSPLENSSFQAVSPPGGLWRHNVWLLANPRLLESSSLSAGHNSELLPSFNL